MHKNKFQVDQRLNTKSNRNLEDKILYCKNQHKQSSKTSGKKYVPHITQKWFSRNWDVKEQADRKMGKEMDTKQIEIKQIANALFDSVSVLGNYILATT